MIRSREDREEVEAGRGNAGPSGIIYSRLVQGLTQLGVEEQRMKLPAERCCDPVSLLLSARWMFGGGCESDRVTV